MQQIHWRDLPGNKYLKKIEPRMLLNSGCVIKQLIKPIGSKRFEDCQWVEVLYDMEYITEKIQIDFVKPLNIQTLGKALSLITETWIDTLAEDLIIKTAIRRRKLLSDLSFYGCFNGEVIHIYDLIATLEKHGYLVLEEDE